MMQQKELEEKAKTILGKKPRKTGNCLKINIDSVNMGQISFLNSLKKENIIHTVLIKRSGAGLVVIIELIV